MHALYCHNYAKRLCIYNWWLLEKCATAYYRKRQISKRSNCAFTRRFVMKCSVTVRFLIVFLTVVFMVLSGIAGERLYIYARTTCQRACAITSYSEMTLEILNFGVHCFARTRNLLEIRYPDNCSVYLAKKHGRKDLQQDICVFPDSRIRSIERTLKNCSVTDN